MKPKLGDIVEVEFLDHVEDGGDPMQFKVWGLVAKVTTRHLEILSWANADGTESANPHNEKRWTIVRPAIIKMRKMIHV